MGILRFGLRGQLAAAIALMVATAILPSVFSTTLTSGEVVGASSTSVIFPVMPSFLTALVHLISNAVNAFFFAIVTTCRAFVMLALFALFSLAHPYITVQVSAIAIFILAYCLKQAWRTGSPDDTPSVRQLAKELKVRLKNRGISSALIGT